MLIPGKALHNETQRHVARMSAPDNAHIIDLHILIRDLSTTGVWSLLDVLCVAGPTAANALLDLKGNQDSVLVGSPAFVADEGFTTVSTTDVINTQFSLTADHAESQSMAVYVRSPVPAAAGTFIGEYYQVGLYPNGAFSELRNGDAVTVISNLGSGATGGLVSSISSAADGFLAGSRGPSSAVHILWDSVLTSGTKPGSFRTTGPFSAVFVGCQSYNISPYLKFPSPNQYAMWAIGKGLTQSQAQSFATAVNAYFTRRGTAV